MSSKNRLQAMRGTLRAARQKERGKIETGFKQCLCNNQSQFDIEEDPF
ncbi:hypothetical protein [Paenibacillus sp. AR247]|nr:hypothetical protein [Paenibacillus sp. AR247]